MKKFLFMCVVASSLLACNNQDIEEVANPTGESSVTLSIKQALPASRGVSNPKGTNEYAVIGSGKLFFIDSSDNSIYQRELTASEINSIANTESTAGDKTITFTGIPNTATTLYFMANIQTSAGSSFVQVEGTTSADARLRIDKLQADDIHVPMSGRSSVFTKVSDGKYTASVTLTPIVARLEIGQVTCQNSDLDQPTSADITGYKLSGVFINNVRQAVLLSGTPYLVGSPIDIKAQSGWTNGWSNHFMPINIVFPYYIGGNPAAPNDWVSQSMVTFCNPDGAKALSFYPDFDNGATSTAPAPDAKKVWGYQICPSTTVSLGQPADVPHVILKLTEVGYRDNPLAETTKYVTVTNYKDNSGNPISEFERGNVYRISNLIFTHNQATNQPYEKNISVTATVSVAPWVINSINPDWN